MSSSAGRATGARTGGRTGPPWPLPAVGPIAGATVMGTGIVSTALLLTGHATLSDVGLWVTVALWAALAGVLIARGVGAPRAVLDGAHRPVALTAVAGTCVLGTRLAIGGRTTPAIVLLVLGAAILALLLVPVLRRLPARRAPGADFLVCVAPASVAVLAAAIATARGTGWLLWPAAALLVVALVLYLDALRRFDPRELLHGPGDQWVAGGALAICALACADIDAATKALGVAGGAGPALHAATLVLWIVAMAWLPVLVVAEAARPRPRYDARRWATVFPVGMYAAMSAAAGKALPAQGITDFARVWTWVAVAVWAVVACGLLRRVPAGLRPLSAPAPPSGRPGG